MLIEFSVGNFRSFQKRVTLSMVASNIRSRDRDLDEHNVFAIGDKVRLLKTAAIYGANASGKSNLVRALRFMRRFVLNSSKDAQAQDRIRVEPFKLSTKTENAPSSFEIVFLLGGTRYRYGFEADSKTIKSEWLFYVPSTKEAKLFTRDKSDFSVASGFKEGSDLPEKTRSNALFLSVVAQFNGAISQRILEWFEKLQVMSGLEDSAYRDFTIDEYENNILTEQITSFVRRMDVGIDAISIEKQNLLTMGFRPEIFDSLFTPEGKEQALKTLTDLRAVKTLHKKFGKDQIQVGAEQFDLDANESEGTQKIFALSGPLLDALKTGNVLVIDELDARLHPLITLEVIRLFNSEKTNPNNGQLIFTTHDTLLLNNKNFRRDQIWFAEKDRYGATDLYSLVEIKVRNDASFEKDYISGKYGAIPFIGSLKLPMSEEHG